MPAQQNEQVKDSEREIIRQTELQYSNTPLESTVCFHSSTTTINIGSYDTLVDMHQVDAIFPSSTSAERNLITNSVRFERSYTTTSQGAHAIKIAFPPNLPKIELSTSQKGSNLALWGGIVCLETQNNPPAKGIADRRKVRL